jgi:hypothetical protein
MRLRTFQELLDNATRELQVKVVTRNLSEEQSKTLDVDNIYTRMIISF